MLTTAMPTHPRSAYMFILSRVLERASFYGIRSIITLYLFQSCHFLEEETIKIYGLFASSLLFSQIIGALIGDLLLGTKKTIILGGLTQLLGCLSFLIPTVEGAYVGIGLLSIGSGLFSSNFNSQYGKIYLKKSKIMDAGFSILYTFLNIGAFLGTIIFSYFITDLFSYKIGFVLGGILILFSTLIFYKIPENSNFDEEEAFLEEVTAFPKISPQGKAIILASFLFLMPLFWIFYGYCSESIYTLSNRYNVTFSEKAMSVLMSNLSIVFLIPVGILLSIIWSYYAIDSKRKIAISFILMAITMGILSFFGGPFQSDTSSIIIYCSLLLALAEFWAAPIFFSFLTQHVNPRYLALCLVIPSIMSTLVSYLFMKTKLLPKAGNLFFLGAILSLLIGLVLFFIFRRKTKRQIISQ